MALRKKERKKKSDRQLITHDSAIRHGQRALDILNLESVQSPLPTHASENCGTQVGKPHPVDPASHIGCIYVMWFVICPPKGKLRVFIQTKKNKVQSVPFHVNGNL